MKPTTPPVPQPVLDKARAHQLTVATDAMFTVSTDEEVYAFVKTGHFMEAIMMCHITDGIRRTGEATLWYCPDAYDGQGERKPLKIARLNRRKYMVFKLEQCTAQTPAPQQQPSLAG